MLRLEIVLHQYYCGGICMIRDMDIGFWSGTYSIEELRLIQDRKRKEIWRLGDRGIIAGLIGYTILDILVYITIIVYARYRLLTRLTCWPAVKEYHQCFSDCHQS